MRGLLEANCISNLSPTLQLTTHGTSVRESLQLHNVMVLIKAVDCLTDVQWSLYPQGHGCYCSQWRGFHGFHGTRLLKGCLRAYS